MKNLYSSIVLLLFVPALLIAQNNFTKNNSGSHAGAACCYPAAQSVGQNNSVLYDGNGVLGPTYTNTACGLNYVQGSVLVEQRSIAYSFNTNGTGLPTNISIAGLPGNYVLDRAYLWYIASYYETTPPPTNITVINPVLDTATYEATLIGQDGSKCWQGAGEVGTACYRADLTPAISGNGNYNINITGFTGTGNGSNEVDGTTLMIIYKDTTAAYEGSLVIWDGLITCGVNNGYNNGTFNESQIITGFTACNNSTYANAFLIASDLQSNVNGGVHKDTINMKPIQYSNIFWDFDTVNTSVYQGQNNALFSVTDQGDCYSIGAVGLYYQDTCMLCGLETSITELSDPLNMTITPNPMTSSSVLQLSNRVKDADVVIYDMVGKEVLRRKLTDNKTEIRKGDLERGIYFVRVNEYIKKLIVE